MLVSVHIPKCAGTSFQHVLLRIYGRRATWLNYDPAYDPAFYEPETPGQGVLPKGVRCVHGHFLSTAFDGCPGPVECVTWLRDPVQRVISHYYHFLRHPDSLHPCCRELAARRLSLERFAELDLMRNEMSRYVAGKPLADFRFVGVMEQFKLCLDAFGAALGVSVPGRPPRENVNPLRTRGDYSVSDRVYEHILSLNWADAALYAQAAARLTKKAA